MKRLFEGEGVRKVLVYLILPLGRAILNGIVQFFVLLLCLPVLLILLGSLIDVLA